MDMKKWLQEMLESPTKKAMPILSFPSASLLGMSVAELLSSAENQAAGIAAVAFPFLLLYLLHKDLEIFNIIQGSCNNSRIISCHIYHFLSFTFYIYYIIFFYKNQRSLTALDSEAFILF